MRILLTGSSGFIGRHLHTALVAAGHHVIPIARRAGVDMNQLLTPDAWLAYLAKVDVVINSVGIIAETQAQTFAKLHTRAPIALFQAAQQMGVKRIIQISALGADAQAFSAYHLSKKAADDVLSRLALDWFILRPSLVYGEGGSSAALFKRLASLPLIPLPDQGQQHIQPVHISDVVATIMQALHATPTQRYIEVVGAYPVTLKQWLQQLRQAMGKAPAVYVPVPYPLIKGIAQLLHPLLPLFHPDSLRMLQAGNTADVQALAEFLGRLPLSVEQMP